MNCLFVDDDIDDQEIFSFALKALNKQANIVTAENGLEALRILNEDKSFIPDCIFLDLNMPGMGGKECLPELRKISRLKDVPVIIYTTSTQEADKRIVQSLGATDFISKESSMSSLQASLRDLFYRHNI